MDIEKYIDSMHPTSEKERKKLKKILCEYYVYDNKSGIREIRVPKGYYIPFREHLYSWNELIHAAVLKPYNKSFRSGAGLDIDEYGMLWLRIHYHDSVYDDDLHVCFPVEDANEAEFLYDMEGPNITKYFWNRLEEGLILPHFRFNDSPYFYLATKDLIISQEEIFDQLVTCNVIL